MFRYCLIAVFLVSLSLPAYAKRIVSISPVITEIIYALKQEASLVGVTEWCNYPEAAKALPKVGDAKVNLEKIVALEPDLVLGQGNGDFLSLQLKELGIDHRIYTSPKTVNEIFKVILDVGNELGVSKNAQALVLSLKLQLESIKAVIPEDKAPARVFVMIWTPPLMSAGPSTYINDLIRLAGGRNIMDDSPKPYPRVNREVILKRNPDVIILAHPSFKDKVMNERYLFMTNAGQRGRIFAVPNPDLISRAGPRFLEAISSLKAVISQVPLRSKEMEAALSKQLSTDSDGETGRFGKLNAMPGLPPLPKAEYNESLQ